MSNLDLQELHDFALGLAKQAGAKIKAAFVLPKNIDYKGQIDLVTETDKAVEDMVVGAIKAKYPDHLFVAEEVKFLCLLHFLSCLSASLLLI